MKRHVSELTLLVDKKLFIKGITREELAEVTEVSYQYINNILTSRAMPSAQLSEAIALLLDIKPERFRRLLLKCRDQRKRINAKTALIKNAN